ncbi:hypothetical protein H310_09931 [Aphanomyces invadans]|uniref:Uncharacterized protein n=1 Tax=Aphanomyces invadans TaxID=157072 RepID=A0A024TSJ2_9STRA|nr:hypothetical protein H310_09931 [Aphanomyces invadans]ETV97125.1 hypothetical protein H310_09931 [Aphanomyces invadans]|eukprot:XP_008874371.1 hypothetical protein H310_09931 [Aphanomyces invadans]
MQQYVCQAFVELVFLEMLVHQHLPVLRRHLRAALSHVTHSATRRNSIASSNAADRTRFSVAAAITIIPHPRVGHVPSPTASPGGAQPTHVNRCTYQPLPHAPPSAALALDGESVDLSQLPSRSR